MRRTAYHILRLGLGVTFLYIGAQIWRAPEAWGGFIQPWALDIMPGSLVAIMKQSAVLDIIIGIWMIIGWRVWIPALLGTIHLGIVLITTTGGWWNIIERDIGLFAATLALFVQTTPERVRKMLHI